MLVFVEGGKPENKEKNPRNRDNNQQQTQPTYDVESGNRTSHIGGRRVLSPLRHPCSHILRPLSSANSNSVNSNSPLIRTNFTFPWLKFTPITYFVLDMSLKFRPDKIPKLLIVRSHQRQSQSYYKTDLLDLLHPIQATRDCERIISSTLR